MGYISGRYIRKSGTVTLTSSMHPCNVDIRIVTPYSIYDKIIIGLDSRYPGEILVQVRREGDGVLDLLARGLPNTPVSTHYIWVDLDFGVESKRVADELSNFLNANYYRYGFSNFNISDDPYGTLRNIPIEKMGIRKPYTSFNNVVAIKSNAVEQFYTKLVTDTLINDIQYLWTSPKDWIQGIKYFPFNLGVNERTGNISIGTYNTGVIGSEIPNYIYKNLFSYDYNNYQYRGAFWDYSGYTKLELYLPFIGWTDVDVNAVIHYGNIYVDIFIDLFSGEALYYVCLGSNYDDRIIYSTHSVMLAVDIPLSASNMIDLTRNMLYSAASIAVGALAPNPATISRIAKTVTRSGGASRTVSQGRNKMGQFKQQRVSTTQTDPTTTTTDSTRVSRTEKNVGDIADSAIKALSNFNISSTYDKTSNSFVKTSMPKSVALKVKTVSVEGYNTEFFKLFGKPLGKVVNLGTLQGYTEIGDIHLEIDNADISPTLDEMEMLETALYEGIIL